MLRQAAIEITSATQMSYGCLSKLSPLFGNKRRMSTISCPATVIRDGPDRESDVMPLRLEIRTHLTRRLWWRTRPHHSRFASVPDDKVNALKIVSLHGIRNT